MPRNERLTIHANLNNASATVQGEVVILEMASGRYFGLNRVGTRVWQLIQSPIEVSELADQMTQEFDVERDKFLLDLTEFISRLESANLVTLT